MFTTRVTQIRHAMPVRAIVGLASGWLLLLLTGYVAGRFVTDASPAWDVSIGTALHGARGTALTHIMRAVTALGSPAVLDVVFVASLAFLLIARRIGDAGFLVLASSAAVLLERLLKHLVDRPRPTDVQLVSAHGPSWPSGHASSSLALYAALLILAFTDRRRGVADHRFVSHALIAAGVVIVVLIGLSRVYLGVHNPTDVVAGWMLSGTWLAVLTLVTRSPREPVSCGTQNAKTP